MYEVEYNDVHTAYLAAKLIVENLFAQVDQAGNRFTILDSIIGTRTDGTQIIHQRCIRAYINGHKEKGEHNKRIRDFYSVEGQNHHLEHTEECKGFIPSPDG